MKVHYDMDSLLEIKNPIITVGTFDGVHLGHQKIISKVKDISKLKSIPSVVLSFNPHTNYILKGCHFKTNRLL